MSFLSDFGDLLPDTVAVTPTTGRDGYGAVILGTSTSYSARVITKTEMVRDHTGEEKISRYTVILPGNPTIPTTSLVTLNGVLETILSVSAYRDDLNLPSHTVIRL